MAPAIRIAVLLALAGLAACGKMGPPNTPPGSTYPKGYPEGATAKPVTGLTGVSASSQVGTAGGPAAGGTGTITPPVPVQNQQPQFTKNGSWVDPDMHRPVIDPKADQDKWDQTNSTTFGY